MSHFKAKMHQIRFPVSVRSFVCRKYRWSLTHTTYDSRIYYGDRLSACLVVLLAVRLT